MHVQPTFFSEPIITSCSEDSYSTVLHTRLLFQNQLINTFVRTMRVHSQHFSEPTYTVSSDDNIYACNRYQKQSITLICVDDGLLFGCFRTLRLSAPRPWNINSSLYWKRFLLPTFRPRGPKSCYHCLHQQFLFRANTKYMYVCMYSSAFPSPEPCCYSMIIVAVPWWLLLSLLLSSR